MSRRPLTISDFLALGEDDRFHWELQEGVLVKAPSPKLRHNVFRSRLDHLLEPQLPSGFASVPDIDVDLELVPEGGPATVRRPDLVVVEASAVDRVDELGGILRASDVHLVVEVLSPSSRRMDYQIKRSEFADAGIPHYWIIDLELVVSLVPLRLTEELGYLDNGAVTGVYTTDLPYPLSIDLDRLASRREP